MIFWLVAAPVVMLLLAFAGANWKVFHLAYCKHLIASDDIDQQQHGTVMVMRVHLYKGMPFEEVRRALAPAKLTEIPKQSEEQGGPRLVDVSVGRNHPESYVVSLLFDGNDKLDHVGLPDDIDGRPHKINMRPRR
jgi:hypothetical protein